MQTTDAVKTQITLSPDEFRSLRLFAAQNLSTNSDVVSAMIEHCISNRHFHDKFAKSQAQKGKKEAIDY